MVAGNKYWNKVLIKVTEIIVLKFKFDYLFVLEELLYYVVFQ